MEVSVHIINWVFTFIETCLLWRRKYLQIGSYIFHKPLLIVLKETKKIQNIVFPVSKYTIVINKKVFNILNEYVLRGYKMFDKNSIYCGSEMLICDGIKIQKKHDHDEVILWHTKKYTMD